MDVGIVEITCKCTNKDISLLNPYCSDCSGEVKRKLTPKQIEKLKDNNDIINIFYVPPLDKIEEMKNNGMAELVYKCPYTGNHHLLKEA